MLDMIALVVVSIVFSLGFVAGAAWRAFWRHVDPPVRQRYDDYGDDD